MENNVEKQMDLRAGLRKVLQEWPNETKKPFGGNPLAQFIRSELTSIVGSIVNQGHAYEIESSPGKGVWANVAWLSILDEKVTTTTQNGIYPVYLFCADSNGVYLSLNQGTTQPKKELGAVKAKIRSERIAKLINNKIDRLSNWSPKPLNLRASTSLGSSYEKPNIAAKFYPANSIPSNEILTRDLKEMVSIYQEVVEMWPSIDTAEPSLMPAQKELLNLSTLSHSMRESGLIFPPKLPLRFTAALQTKPFVILTGLSGSGKTKLAEAFSLWMCESPQQYCMVAVGADWTNREPLLGFPNALDEGGYIKPDSGVLDLILRAVADSDKPYFLILDEMNMSHVERYFADFLSAMESNDCHITLHPEGAQWDNCNVPATLSLPKNLFVIGTVNIDETTYMFSPKVLDRANVIEFRVSRDEMSGYFENPKPVDMERLRGNGASMAESFVAGASNNEQFAAELGETLMPFFNKLQGVGAEFGYRTASEISQFVAICSSLSEPTMSIDEVIDAAIIQKLLPKLHGSRNKIEKVLQALGCLCLNDSAQEPFQSNGADSIKYPLSYEKLQRMHKRVIADGFTSFAEA